MIASAQSLTPGGGLRIPFTRSSVLLQHTETLALVPRARHDWASRGKGARKFKKFRQAVVGISEENRKMLMCIAEKMVRGRKKK